MRQYLNGSRARINPQHIVAHVIGHIHASGAIEPDTVPHAVIGQRDKHLRLAGRRGAADGLLLGEIDRENIPRPITSRSLDPSGKGIGRRQGRSQIEFFIGDQRVTSHGQQRCCECD